jgi:hypothetical protein
MMHFRKILFPIAFCKAAAAMASSLREMAERFNATVTVLNACNLAPGYIRGGACQALSQRWLGRLTQLKGQKKMRYRGAILPGESGQQGFCSDRSIA